MPVVDPWFIYALQVAGDTRDLLMFLGVFTAVTLAVVSVVLWCMGDLENDVTLLRRSANLRKFILPAVLVAIIGSLVPTRTTLVAMLVADNVTVERVENVLDYIDERLDKGED